jgi:5-hydroxyisourate hydrolase
MTASAMAPADGSEKMRAVTSLSTHVLDTAAGAPAQGVQVELHRGEEEIASGATDADGRIKELAAGLEPGPYRLVFHPPSPFFRRVELEVVLGEGHHHVPLLVSPYGCASYRGS